MRSFVRRVVITVPRQSTRNLTAQVDVATSDVGRSSVCFHFVGQQSQGDGDPIVCFEASVTKVCCSIEGMTPVEIPADIREFLISLEVSR